MESFQVLNLWHRINYWLLKAMKTGPTDILLTTTHKLCSLRTFFLCLLFDCIIAYFLRWKVEFMSMCLSKCYPQGPYGCCCYTDRTRGSSLLQGPTTKAVATPWAPSALCREQQGQTHHARTRPAAHGQTQLLRLSSEGCKGPCSPNCTKEHLLRSQKHWGESWWHVKNKSSTTSRNCLVNHQLQVPVPTAWNALWLMGIFQSTRNNHCHCPGCSARSALHTKNVFT